MPGNTKREKQRGRGPFLGTACHAFPAQQQPDPASDAGRPRKHATRRATHNPARYFDRLGGQVTIEKGKLADLALLDANPLDDIKNTPRIAAVVSRGKLYDCAAIRRMLAEVEARASGRK